MPQNTLGSGDILAAEHPDRRFAIRGSGFQHNRKKLYLSNLKFARAAWGPLSSAARKGLERLTKSLRLSVEVGDILFLDGRWYVTHSGLLRIAQRR